jgi:hypothetical protein
MPRSKPRQPPLLLRGTGDAGQSSLSRDPITGVYGCAGSQIHRHPGWLCKKRNVSSYDVAGAVSDKEADEMFKLAASLRADAEKWIRAAHPELFKASG